MGILYGRAGRLTALFGDFRPGQNEAFAALPPGTVPKLLRPANKAQLTGVLTYHVVAGAVRAEALKDGEKIKTVEGEELTVRISGKDVFINSAKVTIMLYPIVTLEKQLPNMIGNLV